MASKKQISGNTLDVYLCILNSPKPIGVRDIWRELDLSTPSLAQYHINKLNNLELIDGNLEGKYSINEEERIDALRSFLILRGKLIPRLVIYATLLSGLFVTYLVLYPWHGDFRDLLTTTISIISIACLLFETYKQHRVVSID